MSEQYTIAIIDDDDIYRYTISRTIEKLGIAKKIAAYTSGQDALNAMLDYIEKPESLPDIILLDVNMPNMDGFEFMKEYMRFPSEIKNRITVFMISSSINPVDIDRAKNNPEISDYIVKPIGASKLEGIISSIEKN